jgi:hypothetical protein
MTRIRQLDSNSLVAGATMLKLQDKLETDSRLLRVESDESICAIASNAQFLL